MDYLRFPKHIALPIENELLLRCARIKLDNEHCVQINKIVYQDINWNYLLEIAESNGIVPLLNQNLSLSCPDTIPRAVLDKLRIQFKITILRNQFLADTLLQILNILEDHNIPAIPFKGPVLAASVYSNLSLRQFSDLDILVHRQDLQQVVELLLTYGYDRGIEHTFLMDTHLQAMNLMHDWGEYPLQSENGLIKLDLHGRLVAGDTFDLSSDFNFFWEDLEAVNLQGQSILTFSPENLLLYLCIHGTKDLWKRLCWICDVAETIRVHQKMDWEQLVEKSSALGCEQMLFLGLSLAHNLLSAPLPEQITQLIQSHFRKKFLLTKIQNQILGKERKFSFLGGIAFRIQMMDQTTDKVKTCFKFLLRRSVRYIRPNCKDQEFLPLPYSLYFLYYIIRPIRLFIIIVSGAIG